MPSAQADQRQHVRFFRRQPRVIVPALAEKLRSTVRQIARKAWDGIDQVSAGSLHAPVERVLDLHPLLLAQEARLLQSDSYLIGRHTQQQSLRLRREISALRSGYDDSNFALDSQSHGQEGSLLPTEMAAHLCRPLLRVISESLIQSMADLFRILRGRVMRRGP